MKDLILKLQLVDETIDSTYSKLIFEDEFLGFVLEDGYRKEKEPGHTRIPAGTYRLAKRTRGTFYGRYRNKFGHQFVVELQNVPGFADILIHIGNSPKDTRGCLLINSKITFDNHNKTYIGEGSTDGYKKFYYFMVDAIKEYDNVYIKITR